MKSKFRFYGLKIVQGRKSLPCQHMIFAKSKEQAKREAKKLRVEIDNNDRH